MEKIAEALRKYWGRRFPEISEEWPYWWIEGDGYCLGVESGDDLSSAIDTVEQNWERFASIKAHRAKLLDNDLIRKDRHSDEICNRRKTQQKIDESSDEPDA